ncbi:MAG: apolipoprotein N-acyltransferase [Betaproteobacteria bacterium]|nr:apolipoprotein N-acyltransferase [Betaproteobacteria bacterium]
MQRSEFTALLLGALTVCGFAPLALFPLPLATLAALFVLWRNAGSQRQIVRLGCLWGFGCFFGGVSWIYISLHDVGGMLAPLAAAATLIVCVYLALFPALAGTLYWRLQSGIVWRDVLLLSGLWVLSEWLRGWLFTGFPWLALGYSQSPPSPLSGYAALIGVYGISLVVAVLAALLACAWRRPASWLVLVGLCAGGYALQNISWTQPTGAPLTVSLLQGNISQEGKWDLERLDDSLSTYARLARAHPAQLVVMPETALPMFLDDVSSEYLEQLLANGPTLFGVAVGRHEPGKPEIYFNAAVAMSVANQFQVYAKSHLVPFGEYVPPGFSWFLALLQMPMSDFTPGAAHQPPLNIAGQLIAPNICYEDLFGEEILAALPQATLLINLSNTAWFGNSLAQPQHLQIAQMRALETGRYMLRATNTGMTAVVRPDGIVAAALPAFTADALTAEVSGYAGMTPFTYWGNALALIVALGTILPAMSRKRHKPGRLW